MKSEIFDLSSLKVGDSGWAINYCLNRVYELKNIESTLKHLLVNGGIGGDIDWGIHKWDEFTEEDYGVGRFDGYRYYVGEKDHGILGRGYIEEFTSEERLKELLAAILNSHMGKNSVDREEVTRLANEFAITL